MEKMMGAASPGLRHDRHEGACLRHRRARRGAIAAAGMVPAYTSISAVAPPHAQEGYHRVQIRSHPRS